MPVSQRNNTSKAILTNMALNNLNPAYTRRQLYSMRNVWSSENGSLIVPMLKFSFLFSVPDIQELYGAIKEACFAYKKPECTPTSRKIEPM